MNLQALEKTYTTKLKHYPQYLQRLGRMINHFVSPSVKASITVDRLDPTPRHSKESKESESLDPCAETSGAQF